VKNKSDYMSIYFIVVIHDVTARSVVIGRRAAGDAVIGQWVVNARCVDSRMASQLYPLWWKRLLVSSHKQRITEKQYLEESVVLSAELSVS